MPLYVSVMGWKADGARNTDDGATLRHLLDRVEDHTDETLRRFLTRELAELPQVTLWCLTVLEGGLFDGGASSATLHRINARGGEATSVAIEVPPDAGVELPLSEMTAVAASPEAQAVVDHILGGNDPLPTDLERKPKSWLTLFTSRSEKQFHKAARSANRILETSHWDPEARAERKDLVAPMLQALDELDVDSPRRNELWELLSQLRSAKIRARTVTALRECDPALDDGHIDRQHKLVFEELPTLVAEALTSDPGAPWILRAVRILEQYDLAKPEWPRGD